MRHQLDTALALSAALINACSTGTDGASLASESLTVPAHVTGSLASCSATTTMLTVDAHIDVAATGLRVVFSNNARFTHEASVDVLRQLPILPVTFTVPVPTDGATMSSARPWVWLELFTPTGEPIGVPIFLGDCANGATTFDVTIDVPADVLVRGAVTTQCANAPGPTITLDGTLRLDGLRARIVLTGRDVAPDVSSVRGDEQDVALLVPLDHSSFEIPKQPVRGGAGGNPWIYLEPIDATGAAIAAPLRIGRCVDFDQDEVNEANERDLAGGVPMDAHDHVP